MNTMEKKLTTLELTEESPDVEKLLLARLKNTTSREDYFRWMLFVVGFYRATRKIDAATELLEEFIQNSTDSEQSAHCYLALGQMAIDERRHETGLRHFASALELAPQRPKVVYVLHNNIGYCLNTLGRFVEGEVECRAAIEVDWTRASGYRNLGISLQGQNNFAGAAWAFVEAIKVDNLDDRARLLLENLVAAYPSLALQCPWITQSLSLGDAPPPDLPLI